MVIIVVIIRIMIVIIGRWLPLHGRQTLERDATMKSFTDLFIRRPVLALVVNLVILIAGFQAIRTLNFRQYPRSENASITVTTAYIGASADLVRGFVTTPLERVLPPRTALITWNRSASLASRQLPPA